MKRGKTPVLKTEQAQEQLGSVDTGALIGLRDRALIATMLYTCARVGAVVDCLLVDDHFECGRTLWLRLHEKGGKRHEVPAHHKLVEYMDDYLAAAEITEEKKTPLFRNLA